MTTIACTTNRLHTLGSELMHPTRMTDHTCQKKKECTHQKMTVTTLPQELITEILSILPVKPLVRFQCVSKQWFALIFNDSYFIKLHLNRSRELALILATYSPHVYSMVNFSTKDRFSEAVKIKQPGHHSKTSDVVDSCNGLVCISIYGDNHVDEIVIWNPLIRKYKKLPSNPREEYFSRSVSGLSFGYDRVNDDYKVLSFVQFGRRDRLEHVRERRNYSLEVYSLREHSWRRVEEEWPIEEPYFLSGPAIFSNGAFHWLARRETELRKEHVAFDLSTEKFRVHAFPVNSLIKARHCLVDLGGRVCAVFRDLCEVWVMKEYGVESSWTLLYAMEPAYSNLPPLVFSHDGEEVFTAELLDCDFLELYWYDIKKKTRRIVEIQNMPHGLSLPYTCVGSLLLLDADSTDNYLQ